MKSEPWTVKYAPKTIDEVVLSDESRKVFKNAIESNDPNNFLLVGEPGIGKTTLAKIIADKPDTDVFLQNCSIDSSIDVVKSSVLSFCETLNSAARKVIILDEADQLSQQAQMALRNPISNFSNNKKTNISFILTANYLDKIIPALQSRCIILTPKFTVKDILYRVKDILTAEDIKFTKDELKHFVQTVISGRSNIDIRSIIENAQLMSASGKLDVFSKSINGEIASVADYIQENIKSKSIKELRQFILDNEEMFHADYPRLGKELFDRYMDNPTILFYIAEGLYRMSHQLDKEIQFIWILMSMKGALK
jgi:DNA polymerase III delta prime subunit